MTASDPLRAIARAFLWPFSRFFDPRFRGLAVQADAQHSDVVKRLDAVVEAAQYAAEHAGVEVRGAVQAELTATRDSLTALASAGMEATREANELMGRSLGDLLGEAGGMSATISELGATISELGGNVDGISNTVVGLRGDVAALSDTVVELRNHLGVVGDVRGRGDADVSDLDDGTAELLNFAASHRGFAAQRGLWFNLPVSLRYEEGDVRIADTNERIVEQPYVCRAISRKDPGASVLDVGAAESTVSFSLASLGYDVTALDLRPYILEHPGLRSVTADILDWETDDRFDVVLCLSTLEHIGLAVYAAEAKHPEESADALALARMHALTRPGGLLILTVPYGRASADETQRGYERADLERLLEDWEIEDLTIARRQDALTWCVDEGRGDDDARRVALVTALRPA